MNFIVEDIQAQASKAKSIMRRSVDANSAGAQFNNNQKLELHKIVQF